MNATSKKIIKLSASYLVGIGALVFVLTPLFVLATVSLQDPSGSLNPLALPDTYHWHNYVDAIKTGNLVHYFGNSLTVLVMTTSVTLLASMLAGYALRHGKAWKADWIFLFFLLGLILPGFAGTIQSFLVLRELSLLNTHAGLAIIQISGGLALPIFLYLQFFRTVPLEIEEAAVIDGCSSFRLFWTVVFPITLPVTSTCFIIIALNSWNDFFNPLVYLPSPDMRTLPTGLMAFRMQYQTDWQQLFAASVMIAFPITLLYVFVQRFIIKGIVGGAVKG
ncbi:carbohydrate ABC transporter permease [Paenibacillus puldeungensis]|uniref:Carbohydrate ABC transporter permease n=1 Tax=Paenibacillus puldeungensis TaxID=696536 RepID=A0ABW3RYY2_9BACL